MYKVSYTVKNENGYLVEKTMKFSHLRSAMVYVRQLNMGNSKVFGKPSVERA